MLQGVESDTSWLAGALRALSDERRLRIVHILGSGERDAGEIGAALGLSPRSAGRHLALLERRGVVCRSPGDRRRFVLDRRVALLLNASFFSLLGRAEGGPAAGDGPPPMVAPRPPRACLECHHASFVRSVLEDLERLLDEARRYQSRLIQLSSQVLTAHEEERKRVARELHDDTAQNLTSILVRLRLLERSLDSGEARKGVEELRELTGSTLEGVRRLAVDLRPTALDDLGLVAALQSFVEGFRRRWPVMVGLRSNGLRQRLPPQVELVLYRVVQEALYNVAKHAQARNAWVTLQRAGGVVTAVVEDDGQGFDVEEALGSSERGLGLFGMKERLALVGGTLEIDSARGRGTRITARVPLAGNRHRHR